MKIEQEMTWQELFLKSWVYMKFSSRKSFDPSLYMYMYSEQVIDGSFTPFEQYFNKITFDEMMMSVLYQTHTISWMLPLAHWNNSPPLNISLNSHSSSRFRAHLFLPFVVDAAYLAEKQQLILLTGTRTHIKPDSGRVC